MPVTAKLSRRFYEQFGDELTNELVDWFNSVDATYQSDLREFNEINFARFDAKVEQRLAGLEARLGARIDGLDAKIDGVEAKLSSRIDGVEAKLTSRIDASDVKIDGIDAKIDTLETKLTAELGRRIDVLAGTIDNRFAVFEAKMEQRVADRLGAFESRLLRWMLTFWVGSTLTLASLIFAMIHSK